MEYLQDMILDMEQMQINLTYEELFSILDNCIFFEAKD